MHQAITKQAITIPRPKGLSQFQRYVFSELPLEFSDRQAAIEHLHNLRIDKTILDQRIIDDREDRDRMGFESREKQLKNARRVLQARIGIVQTAIEMEGTEKLSDICQCRQKQQAKNIKQLEHQIRQLEEKTSRLERLYKEEKGKRAQFSIRISAIRTALIRVGLGLGLHPDDQKTFKNWDPSDNADWGKLS